MPTGHPGEPSSSPAGLSGHPDAPPAQSRRVRVVLAGAEARRLADQLERILAATEVVEETLTVAAYRAGTAPSMWTEARLTSLRGAAGDLLGALQRTSIEAD